MSYLNVKKYLYLQWLFPIGIRCRTRIVLPLKWCQCTSVSNKLYFSHWIKMIKVFWHYYATFVGGGNGSPPQYSCLENPVDRGAWWAAVHRVAQSPTRLKWLNSSSSLKPSLALCSNIDPSTISVQFSSIQSLSPVQLFVTPRITAPGLPIHHQLLEPTQTHVHGVGDAIQPSHPLSSPFLPAPNPSQHQGLFQWVKSSHEVAKVWEFQL